ncbi:hypothetical protein MC885_014138 [Smutsia gigantea]|nr:hypothetical protein MC885_014138 [Smutsia gigantea]
MTSTSSPALPNATSCALSAMGSSKASEVAMQPHLLQEVHPPMAIQLERRHITAACSLPTANTPPTLMPPRQKTRPCCRKEVKWKKIVRVKKLWKTIGHLERKNAEVGCLVTFPLAIAKGTRTHALLS